MHLYKLSGMHGWAWTQPFLCNSEAWWAKAMLGPRKTFIFPPKYHRVEFNQVVSVVTKALQIHAILLRFFTSVWLFI